ncbi:MAG: hypothetical protein WAN03_09905 [Candidatus Sulfotelmatobacter sp.]
MRQLVAVVLLGVCAALVGCGSNSGSNPASINGTWTATLMDSNNQQAFFQFATNLIVQGNGTLAVSSFTITSPSPCITSTGGTTETGSFSLSGNFNGNVTGTFGFTVQSDSPATNTIKLTGTANGNTISGTWSATGTGCTGNGTFTMTKM